MSGSTRVVIADDHPIIVRGVSREVEATPGLIFVGAAADYATLVALVERMRPDVVSLDLNMPGVAGQRSVRELRERGVRVVVYTLHEDSKLERELKAAGADAVVSKSAVLDVLLNALLGGECVTAPEDAAPDSPRSRLEQLSHASVRSSTVSSDASRPKRSRSASGVRRAPSTRTRSGSERSWGSVLCKSWSPSEWQQESPPARKKTPGERGTCLSFR